MKISSMQLAMMIMGFLFGTTAITTVSFAANQNAWIAYIIGWVSGIIIIGLYAYLSRLNPSKTLVDICRDCFGKILGNIIALMYILHFIYDSAGVMRNFSEFIIVTMYPETPIFFIIVSFLLVEAYILKQDLGVIGRLSELFVPIIFIAILLLNLLFISKLDFSNFSPVLQGGIKSITKVAYEQLMFPFGQAVAFLMIFPYVKNDRNILRVSLAATLLVGFIILNIVLRDISVLGLQVSQYIYPSMLSIKLISPLIEPFPPVVLLVSTLMKTTIYLYAASLGITQIFNLDNNKYFVFPILILVNAITIWDFNSHLEYLRWASEVWLYYAIPFQLMIPVVLLLISLLKGKRKFIGGE